MSIDRDPCMQIKVKRAYEPSSRADGERLLVDRLWPRGVTREKLEIARWAKDVAPSEDLRRWFGHDPSKWDEFRKKYFEELDGKTECWHPILKAAQRGTVTLVYGAKDVQHNQALAFKEYLEGKLSSDR